MFVLDYAVRIAIEIILSSLLHFRLMQQPEKRNEATEDKENKGLIQMNIRW